MGAKKVIKWVVKWIVILITISYLYFIGYFFIGIWADVGLLATLLLIGLLGLSHLGGNGDAHESVNSYLIQYGDVPPPEHDFSPIKDLIYSPKTGELYHSEVERFDGENRYDRQKEKDERQ